MSRSPFHRHKRPPTKELTPRQKIIVTMIADGFTNKQMAEILGISLKTIECHRTAAMQKTGATCLALLVRYAVRVGLVSL
jgi:DNA-binding NarL/FixJ family response regulator